MAKKSEAQLKREAKELRNSLILKHHGQRKTYEQIAEIVGCSRATVQRVIGTAKAEMNSITYEDRKANQLLEMEELKKRIHESQEAGDYKTAGSLLKIWEREAKLTGLDANEKMLAEAAQLSAQARAVQARETLEVIQSVLGRLELTTAQKLLVPGALRAAILDNGLVEDPKAIES